jgi:hypothetical protein
VILIWIEKKTNKQTQTQVTTRPKSNEDDFWTKQKKLLAPKDLGKILSLWWFFKNLQN